MTDYSVYSSPFSWRYGSQEMRVIWSEISKRRLWRKIWVALATAQAAFALVTPEQLEDLRDHQDQVDIQRSLDIEAEIHHDLMAELQVFAAQCQIGGGIIHLGATSADIEDNADAIRMGDSLHHIKKEVNGCLQALASQIEKWADLPVMGFTHLQPAEPTTLGYRLALLAQDLLIIKQDLDDFIIRGKGFKGAVGTAAAYTQLIGVEQFPAFERRIEELLGISFFPVTNQVAPRLQEYRVICLLASIGAVFNKLALDLRLLQSPLSSGISEPFTKNQVGSSAMPFKRNPVQAEKIDSLARELAQYPRIAWDNSAFSALERTLDDSANRRSLLPESFLITDELLISGKRLIEGLTIDINAIQKNLETYAPFSAVEPILMELVRAGANRQVMHAKLRQHSLEAWENIQRGNLNTLIDQLCSDPELTRYMSVEQLKSISNISAYLGIAPQRAHETARLILQILEQGL